MPSSPPSYWDDSLLIFLPELNNSAFCQNINDKSVIIGVIFLAAMKSEFFSRCIPHFSLRLSIPPDNQEIDFPMYSIA